MKNVETGINGLSHHLHSTSIIRKIMVAGYPIYEGTTTNEIGIKYSVGWYTVSVYAGGSGTATVESIEYYDTCFIEPETKEEKIKIIEIIWNAIGSIIKQALWLHWIFRSMPGFIRAPPYKQYAP